MPIDADSFRGKLYLLIVDKLAIGAIIACAFVAYDTWKTSADRQYADAAKLVQLDFERAKLVKEFVPAIADQQTNIVTKAYLLRSAIVTGAIDPETGVELGRALIPAGLEESHFKRVMAAAMPSGIPAVSRHALAMANKWRETHADAFTPTAMINPESGRESIPDDMKAQIQEARLWRAVLLEAAPAITESFVPLQSDAGLSKTIFGLFVLVNPGSQPEAIDLSHSSSRGISAIGHLSRVLFDPRDEEAARQVGRVLSIATPTKDNISLSSATLGVLLEYGPPRGGPIADSLARLLTQVPPATGTPSVRSAFYWLQWRSADLLDAMARSEETVRLRLKKVNPSAKSSDWAGVNAASGTLLADLKQFTSSLQTASGESDMNRVAKRYEDGKLIRRVIALVGSVNSAEARPALQSLGAVSDDKLRNFPFLREEIARAIEKLAASGA